MTLPWRKGTIDIAANKIISIKYNQADDSFAYLNLVGGEERNFNGNHGLRDIVTTIKDMYRRAMQGEHVDYRDYIAAEKAMDAQDNTMQNKASAPDPIVVAPIAGQPQPQPQPQPHKTAKRPYTTFTPLF